MTEHLSLDTFISFPLLLSLNSTSLQVQLMRSSGVTVVFAALSPGLESLLSVHGVIRRASGHFGAEEETDIVIATADGALGTIPKIIHSVRLFLYLFACVSMCLFSLLCTAMPLHCVCIGNWIFSCLFTALHVYILYCNCYFLYRLSLYPQVVVLICMNMYCHFFLISSHPCFFLSLAY